MKTRRNVTYTKVRDKSLEAYKAWVSAFYFRLTGKTADTRTDEQWEQSWREFWQCANKTRDD